jgi:hypothetical protein
VEEAGEGRVRTRLPMKRGWFPKACVEMLSEGREYVDT